MLRPCERSWTPCALLLLVALLASAMPARAQNGSILYLSFDADRPTSYAGAEPGEILDVFVIARSINSYEELDLVWFDLGFAPNLTVLGYQLQQPAVDLGQLPSDNKWVLDMSGCPNTFNVDLPILKITLRNDGGAAESTVNLLPSSEWGADPGFQECNGPGWIYDNWQDAVVAINPPSPRCPFPAPGFELRGQANRHCYYRGFGATTKVVARQGVYAIEEFSSQEAHLLSVDSEGETAVLSDVLGGADAWLGLDDHPLEGLWGPWDSGQAVEFENWAQGQPGHDPGPNGDDDAIIDGISLEWHEAFGTVDLARPVIELPLDCPALGGVVASDNPKDDGEAILIDWRNYVPPIHRTVASYDLLRADELCEFVEGGGTAVYTGLSPTVKLCIDYGVQDLEGHYYEVVVNFTSGGSERLYSNQAYAHPNVLLHEFQPGAPPNNQVVEILNGADGDVDLTGYRLDLGLGGEITFNEQITLGGVAQVLLDGLALAPDQGQILLKGPQGSGQVIDSVYYGRLGGAPTAPFPYSIRRVEGTVAFGGGSALSTGGAGPLARAVISSSDSTDVYAGSWETTVADFNSSDPADVTDLGGALLFNEVDFQGTPHRVELVNPLGSLVAYDTLVLSDGVSWMDTITVDLQLLPGQLGLLTEGTDFGNPISADLMYLYKLDESGVARRIDQIGWGGGPTPGPSESLLRTPDGTAAYLGYAGANWADCGGGDTMKFGNPSPMATNGNPDAVPYYVSGGGNTLTEVVAEAPAGSEILVAPGSYEIALVLDKPLKIYGDGGDPSQVVLAATPGLPAIEFAVGSSGSRLWGVTLAQADGSPAISYSSGTSFLQNLQFRDNSGPSNVGGLYIAGGSPLVEGCMFQRCDGSTGAVLALGGFPTFRDCVFVDNSSDAAGGVFHNAGAFSTVENCVFDRNANHDGPLAASIVRVSAGSVNLSHSAITNSPQGRAFSADGGGSFTASCNLLDGNAHDGEVLTLLGSEANFIAAPGYCQPLAMNYAPVPGSSLLSPPTEGCSEVVGLLQPPCTLITTPAPSLPSAHRLLPAAPNPFNPATRLRFELARPGVVELALFDLRGRELWGRRLGQLEPGPHGLRFAGRDREGRPLASGVYLLRLRVDGQPAGPPARLVLLK